jgi:hypothetical protein
MRAKRLLTSAAAIAFDFPNLRRFEIDFARYTHAYQWRFGPEPDDNELYPVSDKYLEFLFETAGEWRTAYETRRQKAFRELVILDLTPYPSSCLTDNWCFLEVIEELELLKLKFQKCCVVDGEPLGDEISPKY